MFTDFRGNLIKELVSKNSWEFLGIFLEFHPKTLLRNSPECFSVNS